MRNEPILLVLLALTACTNFSGDYRDALYRRGVEPPNDYKAISHCHGYGCKFRTAVALSDAEWQDVTSLLATPAPTPEAEREAVAKTIGRFEQLIGERVGTSEDTYGTFKELGDFQLDCVDESVNTTVYLSLLDQSGLLTYHHADTPSERIPLIHYSGVWPHKTATMTETETQTRYAVDSWFHDNGNPAEIVPLEDWKAGWKPEIHLTDRP